MSFDFAKILLFFHISSVGAFFYFLGWLFGVLGNQR